MEGFDDKVELTGDQDNVMEVSVVKFVLTVKLLDIGRGGGGTTVALVALVEVFVVLVD